MFLSTLLKVQVSVWLFPVSVLQTRCQPLNSLGLTLTLLLRNRFNISTPEKENAYKWAEVSKLTSMVGIQFSCCVKRVTCLNCMWGLLVALKIVCKLTTQSKSLGGSSGFYTRETCFALAKSEIISTFQSTLILWNFHIKWCAAFRLAAMRAPDMTAPYPARLWWCLTHASPIEALTLILTLNSNLQSLNLTLTHPYSWHWLWPLPVGSASTYSAT